MNKEQLINEIKKLKIYETKTIEMYRDMCNRNSIRFQNILPKFKLIEYREIESGFRDSKFDIRFKNGPSVSIDTNGNITYFSTSGFSSHNVEENDLNEVQNYCDDTSTLFSFIRENHELIHDTISSFEIFNWEARKTNLYELEQQLSTIEKEERMKEREPLIGKILTYEQKGHRGRTYNTIIKVTDRTAKRFTFIQIFGDKWSEYKETKAIDYDKIGLLSDKQKDYLKSIGLGE
jgi:hypothetical protein